VCPTMKYKAVSVICSTNSWIEMKHQNKIQVQLRPWVLSDANYLVDPKMPLDRRKTEAFNGRSSSVESLYGFLGLNSLSCFNVTLITPAELAAIMERAYGGVCYAGIDIDPELKYPKGAGRVGFNNQRSYIAAISGRFVNLKLGDIDKKVNFVF